MREEDALFGYATAALLIALVAPADVQSGGSYIPERLALFPVYGLALWLAAHDLPGRMAASAAVVSVLAAVALVTLRLPTTLSLSAAAVEFDRSPRVLSSDRPCSRPTSRTCRLARSGARILSATRRDAWASATRGHDRATGKAHSHSSCTTTGRRTTRSDGCSGIETAWRYHLRWISGDTGHGPMGRWYALVVGRDAATADTLASPG